MFFRRWGKCFHLLVMHLPENKTWFHRLFLSEQQGDLEIICIPHPVINKRFGSKNLTTCPRSHGRLVLELRKFISYDSKIGKSGLTNSFTWANWWVVFVSRGVCAKCILQSQHSQIPKDQRWSQRGVCHAENKGSPEHFISGDTHHSPSCLWVNQRPRTSLTAQRPHPVGTATLLHVSGPVT